MLLDHHKFFVGFDVNPEVLSSAKTDLVLTFVSEMLNPRFCMSGTFVFLEMDADFQICWLRVTIH